MALTEKQRKQIISLVGVEGLKRILDRQQQAEKDADVIEAIGVRSKVKHFTMQDVEASGFTPVQLKYIEMELGVEGVTRALLAGSREKGLIELNKLAKAKKGSKNKATGHTNTVKITSSDSDSATVYKGRQIVDDAATDTGNSPGAIERETELIEDQTERLAWYVEQLKMPANLDGMFRALLGIDETENVYRLALSNAQNPYLVTPTKARKALTGAELSDLDDQRLEAIGCPLPVMLALGTLLKDGRYRELINQLMESNWWGQPMKPVNTKSATKQTIKRDPFFRIPVKD